MGKSLRRSRIGQIWAKSSRQLANELIQRRYLRCETVLEMQALDPHWVVSLYVRTVAIAAAYGWRPAQTV
jgi:hypothetical protein